MLDIWFNFFFEHNFNISIALPSLGFIESRPPLAAARPKCNSILHLFGEWLFEAAHIRGDAWLQNTKSELNISFKFIVVNEAFELFCLLIH